MLVFDILTCCCLLGLGLEFVIVWETCLGTWNKTGFFYCDTWLQILQNDSKICAAEVTLTPLINKICKPCACSVLPKTHFLDFLKIFSLDMGQVSFKLLKEAFTIWQHVFLSTSIAFSSLQIQPPLIHSRYYLRNVKRDVCDSQPEIPYWWCESVLNLDRSANWLTEQVA